MTRFVSVDEACELVTDGTHYTPRDIGRGIPFLTVKDVSDAALDFSNCAFISQDDFRVADKAHSAPRKGDVLFSKDGTVGKVHVVKTDRQFAVLSSLAILRPHAGRVDADYLAHALRSPRVMSDAIKKKTGSAIRRVILSDLRTVRVPLPPLPEQRRIAEVLDKANALGAKRRATLAQLETLTQSIFLEMFGDPATNPKGWPRATLGQLIDFIGGSQPPREVFTYEPSDDTIRLVQIRDFKSDQFKTYIPRRLARRSFDEDDVMIGRYGPPVFQILRGLSGSYNVALMKAQPKNHALKDFIFHLLRERQLHEYVVTRSERTAGQTGVNLKVLEAYPAYSPPVEVQREFARQAHKIQDLSAAQRRSLLQLNALFASAQDRAFGREH